MEVTEETKRKRNETLNKKRKPARVKPTNDDARKSTDR